MDLKAWLAQPDPEIRRTRLLEQPESILHETAALLEQDADQLRLKDPLYAVKSAEGLLELALFLQDESMQATALRLKGNVLIHLNQYEESLTHYAAALEIRQRRHEPGETARIQVGRVAALKNLARYEEALQEGTAAQSVLAGEKQWKALANLEMNCGNIYRQLDRYAEAEIAYTQSAVHFQLADEPLGLPQITLNLAYLRITQDRYEEALSLIDQAHAGFETLDKKVESTRADMNRAIVELGRGNYQAAWDGFQQTAAAFAALQIPGELAVTELYLAQTALKLNLLPEAETHARTARACFAEQQMIRYEALADFWYAMACQARGRYSEALEGFDAARRTFEMLNGAVWTALIDLERSALFAQQSRWATALDLARAAESTFSAYQLTIRQAQSHLLQADIQLKQNHREEARRLYRAVIDLPASWQWPALLYRAHYGLGRLVELENTAGNADFHYQQALLELEKLRHGLRVDEFQAAFMNDKLDIYEAVIRLRLDQGNWEEALHYIELSKSSALLDRLTQKSGDSATSGLPTELDTELQKLKTEWRWHASRVEFPQPEKEGGSTERQTAEHTRHWQELQSLELRINQTLRRIQSEGSSAGAPHPITDWQTFQKSLDPDTLIVEYFSLDEKVLALLVDRENITLSPPLPGTWREVIRTQRLLRLALSPTTVAQERDRSAPNQLIAYRCLHWYYRALVAPWLEERAKRYRKLIIVPHNELYYLPFQAFHDGERYLIEQMEIQYTPGIGILQYCERKRRKQPKQNSPTALIMGYSDRGRLPHVGDEVQTVARTLTGAHLYQEEEVTLPRLQSHASECRILHLSAHADFRDDNPLFSALYLADGPLNVIDLYALKLNASLVTLSACRTGLGRLRGGDIFGLTRGGLYAGATALVVSLWQVNDASTALLMQEFYRQLETGAPIAAALRRAQIKLLTHPDYAHPHYWAPFFMVGADGSI